MNATQRSFGSGEQQIEKAQATRSLIVPQTLERWYVAVLILCALIWAVNVAAQGFSVLHTFTNVPDGAVPSSGLAFDGSYFYGVTTQGGRSNCGTIFRIRQNGSNYVNLYDFAGSDGKIPVGRPTLDGGALIVTTTAGGFYNNGTIVTVSSPGADVFAVGCGSFATNSGFVPSGGLTVSGGTYFGAMHGEDRVGALPLPGGIFKTGDSGFVPLMNLSGLYPNGGLAIGGTTLYGAMDAGKIFRIETGGTNYSIIKTLANGEGAYPNGYLLLVGSNLLGTARGGGSGGSGTIFKLTTNGTDFTVLKSFPPLVANTNQDGAKPSSGLILADDKLFGTTAAGGLSGQGTVFRINTDGTGFIVLKHFPAVGSGSTNIDGASPNGPLALDRGTLYGMTSSGGIAGKGVIFSLVVPPQINTGDASFGVISNYFGFTITGLSNQSIVIEASSNLINWNSVRNLLLTTNIYYFKDAKQITNYPQRLYRIRVP